ncbi:MAG: signal recognition particle-docking protein FtsY [Treponema sp.]|jgi:fused signal recognition particle receptor|nr:signal recognition particle-docking protein FtsY [Treponema sp.]
MKFGEKLKQFFSGKTSLSDELFDDLCDLLIEGDFGAAQAFKTVELLKALFKKESISTLDVIQQKLALFLAQELENVKPAAYINQKDELGAVLLLGVNGVGKTTSAAKLAALYNSKYGKKTVLAAADTFRAAAIDQLKIHGERLNTRVVAHKQGGDPAAVVYDALEAALSSGSCIVIADTAGRMHTKNALVEELRKIDRVVEAKAKNTLKQNFSYLKYLVLDVTTGRNAFAQAEVFHSAVDLDGVILTKYDSTAKGGVVFSLASELQLPVVYLCTGEKYSDIEEFDPVKFSREFAGIG